MYLCLGLHSKLIIRFTYITLECVGLFGMLQVQLLWVTGVLMQVLPVVDITYQLLTFLCMDKSWLIHLTLEMCSASDKVPLVLIVTLEGTHLEEMSHFGIIIHIAKSNLLASVPLKGFFVSELL